MAAARGFTPMEPFQGHSQLQSYGAVQSGFTQAPGVTQMPVQGQMSNPAFQSVPSHNILGAKGRGGRDFAKRKALLQNLRFTALDLPALIMPWLLLCTCLLPLALMQSLVYGFMAVALCTILALGFFCLSIGRSWRMLAMTCVVAVCFGIFLGYYGRSKYLQPFHMYKRSPVHSDVHPSHNPEAYRDAGYITFSGDTTVDVSRGLGYRSGKLWCVAPVLGSVANASSVADDVMVGFWAVGQDCCHRRGFFDCGDIASKRAHGGLVVSDIGTFREPLVSTYTRAAEAAAQTYGFSIPQRPIFVMWAEDSSSVLNGMRSEAVNYAWLTAVIFFSIVPLSALVLTCFGLSLTKKDRESRELNWNPEKVEVMRYGFDCFAPRQYDQNLKLDLVNGRCYFSGEVIYDYVFNLANKHTFIGMLFSHPGHPYSKLERLVVGMVCAIFVVFPMAVFSLKFPHAGVAHTVILLILVTLPRSILRLHLMNIAQHNASVELSYHEQGDTLQAAKKAWWMAPPLAIFMAAGIATAAICVFLITRWTKLPPSQVLLANCDGLVFVALLEPLLGLIMPSAGTENSDNLCVWGFFGRWAAERNFYAPAKLAAEASGGDVQNDASRPPFRSMGSELLFGSDPFKSARLRGQRLET